MELFLIIACFICVFVIFVLIAKLSQENPEIPKLKGTINDRDEKIRLLEKRISDLDKYSVCIDADKEAEDIILRANSKSKRILEGADSEASSLLSDANSKSESMLGDAKKTLEEAVAKADSTLNESVQRAKAIVDDAEKRARDIAGNAYEIAKNANLYVDVVTAMKNIVDGYGFEYLRPTESVLDDLSISYGFTEAGKELANARDLTKRLADQQLASKCDYAEKTRRDNAMAFVLDAFNGKVDSILSLIKKDNYGLLERKVRDAYSLVNFLGRAFRNASITQEYLDARLNELRWGVAVMAIKIRDKEEQRLIKERIREEEKARREYERAMRDAEKEETSIRKELEKTRLELEHANELQKAKYEAMLSELTAKLEDAVAKSQRALSMAQQTRSGHVYIISNIGSFGEDVFKIGMTRRLEPLDRVRELGDASVPFPFDVHAMIYSEDAPTLETELHKFFAKFQVNKINPRKEFFRIHIAELRKFIDGKGIDTQWTILAEASQYRETVALERSFEKDANAQKEWENKQKNEINELDEE